jgi:hypothetical protein
MNRLKTTNSARFRWFNRELFVHNEISFFSFVQQNYPILLSEYHLRLMAWMARKLLKLVPPRTNS